jgi:hypothetical protein
MLVGSTHEIIFSGKANWRTKIKKMIAERKRLAKYQIDTIQRSWLCEKHCQIYGVSSENNNMNINEQKRIFFEKVRLNKGSLKQIMK